MSISTMKLRVQSPDGDDREIEIDQYPCRIGRQKQCTVQLSSWRVAKVHATIIRDGEFLVLIDQGSFSGTWVNGNRIVEYGPLTPSEEIEIAGFRLHVVTEQDTAMDAVPPGTGGTAAAALLPQQTNARLVPVHVAAATNQQPAQVISPATGQVAVHLRRLLHQLLVDSMDLRRQEIRHLNADHLRARARSHLQELLAADIRPAGLKAVPAEVIEDPVYCSELIELVLDEAVGLGVLERLLKDSEISEIMVNGCTTVFTERAGRLEDTGLQFSSDEAILAVIERIVSPLGRRIDEASPMVDARLPDGSRVNAVIPPLSVNGPCITIRRFGTRHFSPAELVDRQSLSADMLTFLTWCVHSRLNVVVSGGTGSGKTTLLNLLSQFIDPGERVITIEDAAELRLVHQNKVTLEARPANAEGSGSVTIRDLVRNALRMRPDRIIVGECRGGEALDMLQAMNTGHNGSLTTVHANSARDVLSRLEVMVLMSGIDVPIQAIREQVASAVDIIVQQTRGRDGSRRITQIAEVTGMEGTQIQMQDLFVLSSGGAEFLQTGHVPLVLDRLGTAREAPVRKLFEESAHVAA